MAVPTQSSKLVPFSTNFNTRIGATPETFGLTAADATAYAALHDPFIAAAAAADSPGARSPSLVAAREAAKAALLPLARELYATVQADREVSDADKLLLGITVRAQPQPVPAPATAPMLEIGARYATTVTVHLHEAEGGSSRAKPAGVAGASVFSYVGATPPATLEGWTFQGNTSRTTVAVVFPESVAPGATVHFAAFWYNPRGESGPTCSPVSAIIAGGGVPMAA